MSSSGGADKPFLSNVDDEDLDLEALSAKACALASVPVPDYASSIEHANKRSKKKYGNRFTIDDDEHEDDGEELLDDKDKDTSIVLAERTSQILSNFQDYVSGIGGLESEGRPSAAEEILSPNKDNKAGGGNEEAVTFVSDVASSIRADNKTKLLSDDGRKGRRQSDYSSGSGPLAREWSYDNNSQNQNLHDAASSIEDWEDPEAFLARGQPYTHPLMPSRRVKIGILNCLAVSAIVALGVGLGVTTRTNTKESEELGEKLDELEEELANNGGGGGLGQSMNTEMGPPPPGYDTPQPAKESSASKIINALIEPPELTKEQQYMYQNMMAKYQPKEFSRAKGWTGKTYLDAFEFCANVKPAKDDPIDKSFTYDICPYEAICPLGGDSQPLGGYKDAVEGYTWTPIRDNANDWAQLSRENACVKYSSVNEYPPEWGMNGNEDEKITSHVMCCLSSESLDGISDDSMIFQITHENAPQHGEDDPNYEIYQAVGMEFLPLEFDRSKGWNGETYLEALQFCGTMDHYEICPYEAICPLGGNSQPLGGVKEDRAGSWVPILDSANDWVQLGRDGTCLKYSGQHGTPPQWSKTGGNEAMTRHVMCCLLRKKAWMSKDDHAAYELQKQQEKKQHLPKTEMDEEMVAKYELAAETYMPIEYDRTKEWDGRTYAQADYFCSGIEVNGRDYRICPYDAICPAGSDNEPLGGYKMDVDQAWMPISDKRNEWVSVTKVNACIKWTGLNPTAPEWGITGQNAEVMTQHILCCVVDDDAVAEEVLEIGAAMAQQEEAFEKEQAEEEMEAVQEEEGAVEAAKQAYAKEMAYKAAAEAYTPITFTREKGWLGRTYFDAVKFCESQVVDGKTYGLCPFLGICPVGPSGQPLGGFKSADQAWIPISNEINDWVQVSELSPSCMKWSDLNDDLPLWGMDGQGSDDITRFLTCCSGVPMSNALESMEYSTDMAYKEANKKYEVQLYDRAKGWNGQSYLAAFDFCGAQGGKTLCPFEAICPGGLDGVPIGGYQDEPNGSWVPVLADEDDPEGNQWVQVSRDNACTLYTASHPTKPDWGVTGEGNEDVTRHLLCCLDEDLTSGGEPANDVSTPKEENIPEESLDEADKEVTTVVQSLLDNFQPISFDRNSGWSGQTYLEAIDFCASVENEGGENETYDLCPYEVLCPFGPMTLPFDGVIEGVEGGATWVPMSTSSNDWVNISPNNPCVKYSSVFSNKPEWGRTGEENEELTRNIFCCKGSIYGKPEESYLYQIATEKYHPIWYDRDSGWGGTKYTDALVFCKSRGATLCPYEAVCPMSDLDVPLGGIIDKGTGPYGAWVPVSDADNAWLSAGPESTCKFYDIVYGEIPEWGLTGEGSEPATRHIMCCNVGETTVTESVETPATIATAPTLKPTSKPSLKPNNPPSNKPTPLPTPLPTAVPTNTPTPPPTPLPSNLPTPRPSGKPTLPPISGAMGTAVESYKTAEKYNPVWYDRSSGWNGQTYDEAFAFCSAKGPNHDICPYEVICPSGPLSMPFQGARTEPMSWAPMNEPFNSWVQVANTQVCVQYKNLNPDDSPSWGLTGVNNEDITRHIMCCDMNGANSGSPGTQQTEEAIAQAYDYVVKTYAPKWYDRSEGWQGKTYTDALTFCASKDSSIPCPYDAVCPMGPGSLPTGGYDGSGEAWAAIMDAPNAWVQIGSYDRDDMSDSCMKYKDMHDTPPLWGLLGNSADDVTPHIMCCKEPADHFLDGMDTTTFTAVANTKNEQEILEKMHPVWFGRKHGYHGKTWQEASDFCAAVGDMTLCPPSAYCDDYEKLFLDKDPFMGEQWAPAASEINTGLETWVSIGQSPSTCSTSTSTTIPQELKENILCCSNPKYLVKEHTLKKDLEPIWMDNTHGWNGGDHDDANEFCGGFGNRQVCPYTAICPAGPGHSVMGGASQDFASVGEQWAPIYGQANKWVMIGQKYQNHATTCMDSAELEGSEGVFQVEKSMKKYIMCCTF